jgi:hypothetical protein
VIDASGRDAFFGGKLGLKRRNKRHQSAAVFSHFHNVHDAKAKTPATSPSAAMSMDGCG